MRGRQFIKARFAGIGLRREFDRETGIPQLRIVKPGNVGFLELQGGPAVLQLHAAQLAHHVGLARLEEGRFLVHVVGGHAPRELVAHADVQSLVLTLDDAAQRAVQQRHPREAHRKVVPRRVRRAAELHDATESPRAFHHGGRAVGVVQDDLRQPGVFGLFSGRGGIPTLPLSRFPAFV